MSLRPAPLTEAAWFQRETEEAGSEEELALRRAATYERRAAGERRAQEARDELRKTFGVAVYRVVPGRYEAYCKLLHPIFELADVDDRELSWDQWERAHREETGAAFNTGNVACDHVLDELVEKSTLWKGGIDLTEVENARRVSWRELADRYDVKWSPEINGNSFHTVFAGSWPRYLVGPEEGDLERPDREALVRSLAPFTSDECFFWFWLMKTGGAKATYEDELYAGRLDELVGAVDRLGMGSPSAFWPADRRWFVATDYDLDFTLIGGERALVHELLDAPGLECVEVTAHTRIDYKADAANA